MSSFPASNRIANPIMCIYIRVMVLIFETEYFSFHLCFSLCFRNIQNVLKDNLEDAIYLIFKDNKIYPKLKKINTFYLFNEDRNEGCIYKNLLEISDIFIKVMKEKIIIGA